MKRKGNIFPLIYDMDNLLAAEKIARKGKKHQLGVKAFGKNPLGNLQLLQQMLIQKTYRTSPYTIFPIYEPKERIIYRLPYFPDRILHHAIMNKIREMFIRTFTADTYSCIPNRGIHAAANAVKRALTHISGGGGGIPAIA